MAEMVRSVLLDGLPRQASGAAAGMLAQPAAVPSGLTMSASPSFDRLSRFSVASTPLYGDSPSLRPSTPSGGSSVGASGDQLRQFGYTKLLSAATKRVPSFLPTHRLDASMLSWLRTAADGPRPFGQRVYCCLEEAALATPPLPSWHAEFMRPEASSVVALLSASVDLSGWTVVHIDYRPTLGVHIIKIREPDGSGVLHLAAAAVAHLLHTALSVRLLRMLANERDISSLKKKHKLDVVPPPARLARLYQLMQAPAELRPDAAADSDDEPQPSQLSLASVSDVDMYELFSIYVLRDPAAMPVAVSAFPRFVPRRDEQLYYCFVYPPTPASVPSRLVRPDFLVQFAVRTADSPPPPAAATYCCWHGCHGLCSTASVAYCERHVQMMAYVDERSRPSLRADFRDQLDHIELACSGVTRLVNGDTVQQILRAWRGYGLDA
eukprot:TRINITY_DN2031_c0_g1_i2.p1 TRINITY_DN2031_c0_g1~~TRINITY_DN2031_c0_g1_i2.p1  ORF type:complete len:437 (-),score=136.76 TRINITY_DN2031_c0_g1_i2:133-1443(-)